MNFDEASYSSISEEFGDTLEASVYKIGGYRTFSIICRKWKSSQDWVALSLQDEQNSRESRCLETLFSRASKAFFVKHLGFLEVLELDLLMLCWKSSDNTVEGLLSLLFCLELTLFGVYSLSSYCNIFINISP
ncbi:hypothetical protein NQ315_011607 [Exocentrus adspersus]|uniref:Uncharacterized protein n=1 Tax=Exocentrus adspersus TaxID=1586481 RepID=A0AAV8VVI2_9CUCU|nr:hypothetical protein NQ315_011607 [Exocentrus adspersus]